MESKQVGFNNFIYVLIFNMRLTYAIFLYFLQHYHRLYATTEKSAAATATANGEKDLKKAGPDAPPVNLGWDTHQAVEIAPESLVRASDLEGGITGNYPMRSKFEKMCREAQISITEAIAKIDGSGKSFQEDCWTRENGGGGIAGTTRTVNITMKKRV